MILVTYQKGKLSLQNVSSQSTNISYRTMQKLEFYVFTQNRKRGIKHFVTRIYIVNNMLYVLTAQIKVVEFDEKEKEIMESVKSFIINTW